MKEPQTFGDLKKLIRRSRRIDGPSVVNRGMTHQQALDVLEAAISQRADSDTIGADVRGDLMKRNVLRECGFFV